MKSWRRVRQVAHTVTLALLGVFVPGVSNAQVPERAQGSIAPSAEASLTYKAVIAGMSCKQQLQTLERKGRMDCEYRVGKSLRFDIAGVGDEDAAVTFLKVDWDGDYYATIGVMHGCVIVKPGRLRGETVFVQGLWDIAFVSPKNGKVYTNWPDCGFQK